MLDCNGHAATGIQAIERIVRSILFSSVYCTLVFAAHPHRYAVGEVMICMVVWQVEHRHLRDVARLLHSILILILNAGPPIRRMDDVAPSPKGHLRLLQTTLLHTR